MDKQFTAEKYQELLKAVDALPPEAVERASKEVTRKGYDTTGYQYQFLVNVLNEVIGVENWGFTYEVSKEIEGKWQSGKPYWEITIDMEVEMLGVKRRCVGGHKSEMHADAKKGAITNALKKTLALFGIGKKAYEGTIDDDYRPLPSDRGSTRPLEGNKRNLGADKTKIQRLLTAIFSLAPQSKEDAENKVKHLTQLELTEENYPEIISRLSVVLKEHKEKLGKL